MAIAVLGVTLIAWFGQGIHDLAIVAYPIVLIYAGLISDKYVLRICGVLTFIALICLAFAEPLGLIFPAPIFRDPYNISYLLVATILMAITVVAVELLSSHLKDSNEKLRRSEEKYSILFNNEIYAIRVVDLETLRILDANEAHSEMYGYSLEKMLLGMSVLDLSAEREPTKGSIFEVPEKGSKHIPLRYQRKSDGTTFPTELVVIPHVWNGQKVEITLVRDITDRVQAEEKQSKAEEELRESERLIEGLLNTLPAGVFWKDKNLSFLGCNLQFAKDAGFDDPSAIIGKDDYEIGCPKEDADRYREIDRRVIGTGTAIMNVEDSVKRNGEDVTDLVSIVPLRGLKGEISGVLGTYIEITDRKRTEKELEENEKRLRESEAKYRKLIETAPEAIYVVENERVVFCNNHALEMLGYSREEMMGIPMEKINHPEDWGQARDRYLSRMAGKSLAKSVGRHVAKDGTVLWIECVGEQIEWEGKDAVLYFSSDITERKKAESERLIVDQYLQQAQKLESLGVLAGGIAHDFNNILMGIFGFVDVARSEAKDPNVADYLTQAMASMQQAKGLTQQLLTFSKGGAPVRKVVEVVPLIKETCQFALHGSKIKNSYDLQENLWNCNIDRNQIGQVLQNVVINAMQSMPLGGTIEVSAKNAAVRAQEHPTLKEGAYIVVRIRDQGIGISKEMLSMIFDPFFTTKTEGHGLGLAISRSIIARHGGAISVESELGKGTTFAIYLPACKNGEAHDSERAEIRHAGEGVILVMDDDEAIRTVLSIMLESLGYTAICRENGKDTIEYFKAEAQAGIGITAVVLDLTVPGGIGGKEVAEELRKLNREVPIFVSSGYADDPVMANPRQYGITASLRKPFKMAELMEMLEKHMGKGS